MVVVNITMYIRKYILFFIIIFRIMLYPKNQFIITYLPYKNSNKSIMIYFSKMCYDVCYHRTKNLDLIPTCALILK